MLRRVLRAMFAHAVEDGWRKDDPSRDVKAIRSKTDGFHSWTEGEIEQFEARHKPGSRARLAFALLLYTGQRRGDTVRMGRQHVRDSVLFLRQQKRGGVGNSPASGIAAGHCRHGQAQHDIPDAPIRQALHVQWLRQLVPRPMQCGGPPTMQRPWPPESRCEAFSGGRLHAHEIAAITGHASSKHVAHYTKAADQQRLATAAIEKVRERGVSNSDTG